MLTRKINPMPIIIKMETSKTKDPIITQIDQTEINGKIINISLMITRMATTTVEAIRDTVTIIEMGKIKITTKTNQATSRKSD